MAITIGIFMLAGFFAGAWVMYRGMTVRTPVPGFKRMIKPANGETTEPKEPRYPRVYT